MTETPTYLRVLIVEDNPGDAELLIRELRRANFDPEWERVATEQDYLAHLDPTFDVILSNYSMSSWTGLRTLHLLREHGLDIPLIFVSSTPGEDVAVAAVREGAADYLFKYRLGRLGPAIRRTLESKRGRYERGKIDRKLQKTEKQLANILEHTAESIIAVNENHQIIVFNKAAEQTFGYTAQEALGQSLDLLIPDHLIEVHREHVLDFAASPAVSRQMEHRRGLIARRKDGSELPVEIGLSKVETDEGLIFTAMIVDSTERQQAEMEIMRLLGESQQRLKQLEALHSIDLAISGSMDLRMTLNLLLNHVESLLDVDAADILLFDDKLQQFKFSAGRGFHTRAIERARVRPSSSFAGRAAFGRKTLLVSGALAALVDRDFSGMYETEGFLAYAGVPLIAKGQIKGVLEVYHRSVHNAESEWLHLLETLAGQAAIAIDNAQLFDDLQQSNIELALAYDATIAGWSRAMDLRDRETEGHTHRVTDLTLKLARAVHISESQLTHIRHGALLHDIGKMGVPDSILLKADALTDSEWETMRKHPDFAYEMLSSIRYLQPALDIPYCHHEKWDGTGYPRGLKGEEIPVAARIFAVADVWDAITSDRPYRKAWSKEEALEYIREQSSKYFDPQVVNEFFRLIAEDQQEK